MNSGVLRLDQIISKLVTVGKHCLQSLLLYFFFAHNLIKPKIESLINAVNKSC